MNNDNEEVVMSDKDEMLGLKMIIEITEEIQLITNRYLEINSVIMDKEENAHCAVVAALQSLAEDIEIDGKEIIRMRLLQ